jgi:crotonobetainyl-CoA:carnitine CoA-transferase CaiB-like acyl-CoA transferase
VVELVRIIAGPVIGTTLAALGADVIRVNCSRLPDIDVGVLAIPMIDYGLTNHTLNPVAPAYPQCGRSSNRH